MVVDAAGHRSPEVSPEQIELLPTVLGRALTGAPEVSLRLVRRGGELIRPRRVPVARVTCPRSGMGTRVVRPPRATHPSRPVSSEQWTAPLRTHDESHGPVLVAEVIGGPDCRPPRTLPGDRIVVGRDPEADLPIDDPSVAPHHVLLAVAGASETPGWLITPLVGASAVRIDGRTVSRATHVDAGARVVRLGVGSSIVEFRWGPRSDGDAPGGVGATPRMVPVRGEDDRWVVHRRLVVAEPQELPRIDVPERLPSPAAPPATAPLGAVVALAGAVVVAAVLGNLMFAVFATVGAVGATALWAGSWVAVLRGRRRARSAWADAVDHFAAAVSGRADEVGERRRRRLGGVGQVLANARALGSGDDPMSADAPGLWAARWGPPSRTPAGPSDGSAIVEGPDAVTVVVARGRVGWQPLAEASAGADPTDLDPDLERRIASMRHLDDVPVTIRLAAGRPASICGWQRDAVARSVIAQLAWGFGPADWQLVIATDRPRSWSWTGALPHAAGSVVDLTGSDADAELRAAVDVGGDTGGDVSAGSTDGVATDRREGPVTVLVVDGGDDLGGPTTVLRRLVGDPSIVAIVLADDPPGWVHEAIAIRGSGAVDHVVADGSSVIAACAVGVTAAAAGDVATALGRLVDPETAAASRLPPRCGLRQLHLEVSNGSFDVHDPADVARRWADAGDDPRPTAIVGRGATGATVIDLVGDGPHALIAGTTGSGKSELLRTVVAGLAVESSPAHLTFVLIDYKGGAAFDACGRLPHVVGSVTDLDHGLAARALSSLDAELRRRSRSFRAVGAADLGEYRCRAGGHDGPMPRLVVVVDEFATLATELPEFLAALVDVARRGRSLGVHLLLATQRPAGVVNDDIRANTALRIALRTQEPAESSDVIGAPDAARLSRSTPGRALRVVGAGALDVFQVATCTHMIEPDERGAASLDLRVDGPDRSMPERETELARLVDAVGAAWAADEQPVLRPWLPPLPRAIAPERLATELALVAVTPTAAGRSANPGDDVHLNSGWPSANPGDEDRPTSAVPPIGVVDDPARQRRLPLRWAPGDGTLVVLGAPGSGTTSTLLAIGAAACSSASPDHLHVYVIDARNDHRLQAFAGVAHCGGVVRLHETERLRRLVERLGPRQERDAARRTRTVLLVDGLDALRHHLLAGGPDADADLASALRELLIGGSDRDVDVVATARSEALPPGVCAQATWVGAVDDPLVARAVGWRGAPVDRATPGRFGIVASGLVGQVALGAPGLAELPLRAEAAGGPAAVEALPDRVSMSSLSERGAGVDPARLIIGLDAGSNEPTGPIVGAGDHLLLVGRPASGVSSALITIEHAWRRRHPAGRVIRLGAGDDLDVLRSPAGSGSTVGTGENARRLVVIDDAHRVDDVAGYLESVIDGTAVESSRTSIVAGVRWEAFRSSYGHWTRALAATERGVAFAAAGDPPTEVFGAPVPRRPLVSPRPGLAWLVENGTPQAIQIALVSAVDDGAG